MTSKPTAEQRSIEAGPYTVVQDEEGWHTVKRGNHFHIFSFTFHDPGSDAQIYAEEHADELNAAYAEGQRPHVPVEEKDQRIAELEEALREAPGIRSHTEDGAPIIYEGVCTDPNCPCSQSLWVQRSRALLSVTPTNEVR